MEEYFATRRMSIVMIIKLFLVITFNSCVYDVDDYYYNPIIENPDPPEISVVQLDLEADTVYVYGDRKITFQFESDNQEIRYVKLLINDITIDSVASSSGKLTFQSYLVPVGIHDLKLQVYTKSGTGSISDILGGESWVFQHNWVLSVQYDHSDNIWYESENGYLKLLWKTYKASDHKSYVISRGEWPWETIAETHLTHYIDSNYVGQRERFSVFVRLKDGSLLNWGSIGMPDYIPVLHVNATPQNEYYIWWNISKFYNGCDNYQITLNKYGINTTESINKNDTVYQLDLKFDTYFHVELTAVPRKPNSTYYDYIGSYRSNVSGMTGIKVNLPNYTRFKHIDQDVLGYCDLGNYYTYHISGNTRLSEQNLMEGVHIYYPVISATGKFLKGYYHSPGKFNYMVKNLLTGQVTDIPDYNLYTGGLSKDSNISDIGTGVIINISGSHIVYDYVNKNILAVDHPSHASSSAKISGDGKYYAIQAFDTLHVYAVNHDNFSSVKVLAIKHSGNYEFDPLNPKILYVTNNGRITLYNCDNSQTLHELEITEKILNIDYFNNQVLCYNTEMLLVISLADGSTLKEIPFNYSKHYSPGYILVNHFIVSNKVAYNVIL
jgi:hypothetical protein